jgi:glycosyltransferase involved in cell wall biosynthesis
VFHFYFGLTLVPRRAQFPILRATRRKSVFHFLGTDIRGKSPDELAYARRADARIVGSHDAIRWVPDAEVIPPGVDLAALRPVPPPRDERPVFVHAPSSRARKGTEHFVRACEELGVELEIVEGVHHAEAGKRLERADVVLDQLNAGWYGMLAIEAMALGKPVVTFLHDEATRRAEEAFGTRVPIVRADRENLVETLRPLAESATERRRIGAESRAYAEHVHDLERVADRLLALYAHL